MTCARCSADWPVLLPDPADTRRAVCLTCRDSHNIGRLGAPAAFLCHGSPGWPAAWATLAAVTGSEDLEQEHGGEVWQYMGTFHTPDGWRHQWRHRSHPEMGGGRWYLETVAEEPDAADRVRR